MAKEVYELNRQFHFTIYAASGMDRLCSIIESLWDTLSFFKLIYGQKLIHGRESREHLIEEHQSYLDALRERKSELLFELLSQNLDKRANDIPYDSEAYFDSDES